MKRRLVVLAAALVISGTGVTLTAGQSATAAATAASVASDAEAGSTTRLPPFAGHTYLITVDNGSVYQNTYSADGTTLTSVTVQGSGVGDSFEATLRTAKVGSGLYFVSWVEPNGVTVSHVMNFATDTVHVFFTYADSAGTRQGRLHIATMTRVEGVSG